MVCCICVFPLPEVSLGFGLLFGSGFPVCVDLSL